MTSDLNKKSPSKKSALVFDLDGTLVDTAEDLAFSVNAMRLKRQLAPLSTREVLNSVGLGAGRLIRQTLDLDPTDARLQETLLREFRDHYAAHQGMRSRPYGGIEEALTKLYEVADLYVLSNKPIDATLREMEAANFTRFFKHIWGGGSFVELKPDPVGICEAAKLSNTDTAHTVMIGDLFVDMETASRAGVQSIFVSWGFGKREDLRRQPTAIVEHPLQLFDSVTSILTGS